ncbi:MAG: enoyl-CoA hydratase/isomerase family protein [Betaproteobacteria bacterium]
MAEPAEGGPPRLDFPAPGRATITLARPAQLNRLHRADLLALQAHCARLAAEPGLRAVVLRAEGRLFCAGFNLAELGSGGTAAADDPQLFERTVDALAALPVPTLARLHGGVHGGAVDLALACDFRVGEVGLQLRMPAARIGLHYYPGGLRRAVSRLGLAAAKRLFLLAEMLDAAQLRELGYLDAVVAAEVLDAEVERIAAALLGGAPLALSGMKRSLDEIAAGTADPAVLAARVQRCAASADLQEGLAALADKRPPRFEGR